MINFRSKLLIIIKRANRCESSLRGLEDVRGPCLRCGVARDATVPRKSPFVSTAPDVHCNDGGEIRRPTYSRNTTTPHRTFKANSKLRSGDELRLSYVSPLFASSVVRRTLPDVYIAS
ncbi:unnamed protein product [Arctia plantaginis]|uniref:Uncharacterized protein n=1 Tax=Arctia plantaginis TaxID=874455 RepID=A0A8S0YYT3_ARCPL|nr:unnamed protein product [Arctia plantaginis]